ncbi:hypothetical protein E4U43_001964 [Claviceps pusilla]|uniref:Uncharacterized protein n=1 Tax=Claviceps pusilla TaxID=123648 RepID=A0A9P7N6X8_9HYPO|nr:hypothetical protein E4U43_001964 [Claviceps pusilla]
MIFPIITLLLGLPAAVLASSAVTDVAVATTNPILNILTNITTTSKSLDEQTRKPMDFDTDRQYKASVLYYIDYIQNLNRTKKNFPVLSPKLSTSEEEQTCAYFNKQFYLSQTNLPIALASNCYTSGIKGSWCNYLVICLRTYGPILADVEAKVIDNLPSCAARLRSRVATIKSFQKEAVEKIERGRYYRKIPFTVPEAK